MTTPFPDPAFHTTNHMPTPFPFLSASHPTDHMPTAPMTPASMPASTQTLRVKRRDSQTMIHLHPPLSTPAPSPTPPTKGTTLRQYKEKNHGCGGSANATYFKLLMF